ncbi:acyl transferase/acyl hydrolase/lysophospholipase [Mycena epipterygia]|nr:acyl transferase/acyl hydrolase/lysophospholipase [Mycena epipterygia]
MSRTPPKHHRDLGVRVLSLDGGGAGALSELLILERMMYQMKIEGHLNAIPSPCEYFEVIGGSGTGGIISTFQYHRIDAGPSADVNSCRSAAISAYQTLRPPSKLGSTEEFQTSKFEEALKKIFKQEQMLDPGPDICKVMNESNMNAGIPHLFRSYNTLEEPASDCMTWQAARATSATPGLFKLMQIVRKGLKQRFIDGCVGNNNPTSLVIKEAQQMYPSQPIVLVASIGTGHPETIQIPKYWTWNRIAKVMKSIAVDCEKTHEDNAHRFRSIPNTYFRLNVQQGMQALEPRDWNKLTEVSAHTDSYLRTNDAKFKLGEAVKVVLSRSNLSLRC